MQIKKLFLISLFLLLLHQLPVKCLHSLPVRVQEGDARRPVTIVRPREIEDILINPGIGFTTFGQLDGSLPRSEYPASSLAYDRFYWKDIEPEPGKIRFNDIDEIIQQAQARGQSFAFRIMAANGGLQIPAWLLKLGIKGLWYYSKAEQTKKFMPDFADPIFMQHARRLILSLGQHYDGLPALDHVDIGMAGHWGEWHVSEAKSHGYQWPSFKVRQQYIDWHLAAFPHTPLVMQIDDLEGLVYATQRGTGWRADGFGDDYHIDFYPRQVAKANIADVWKTAPVALETFGDLSWWLADGRKAEEIFDLALGFHVSIFNAKSEPVPTEYWPAVNSFLKKIGYRLVLRELKHPPQLTPNESFRISATWENIGVAPPYRNYPVFYRLRRGDSTRLEWKSQAELKKWLPGLTLIKDSFKVPDDLSPGIYWLEVAILPIVQRNESLQLAIEGRRADGWYALSKITIK